LLIPRTVLEKWANKSENHEIWANFGPSNFNGGRPPNFGPNLKNYTYIRPSQL